MTNSVDPTSATANPVPEHRLPSLFQSPSQAPSEHPSQTPIENPPPAPFENLPSTPLDTTRSEAQPSHFLRHIHRLRGIAILLIVAVHCGSTFDWRQQPLAEIILQDFWDNSTVLFVFISGYLFQHLARRYTVSNYLISKFKNVLLPYLIAATPAVLFGVYSNLPDRFPHLLHTSLLYQTLWLYLYGGALISYALWFIPMIALYYLASPLLIQLARHPRLYAVLALLLPLSIFGHRPVYEYGHNLQLALYLLSAYVLGMWFSQYRQRIAPVIDRNIPWLLLAYLAVFVGHVATSSHHGNYIVDRLFDFEHGFVDWLFIQKILLTALLLALLGRCNRLSMRPLDYIAEISFTIYFFHGYFLYCSRWLRHFIQPHIDALSFIALYATVIGLCCLIAWLGKKIFGRWSRSITGY